jgi:predicted RNA binding protein YcfA (HicA-like mRNA interferase family)
VLAALLRIGWTLKRQSGSQRTLSREGWADFVFAFHENEEIGPRMLTRIAKRTGLTPISESYRPANKPLERPGMNPRAAIRLIGAGHSAPDR